MDLSAREIHEKQFHDAWRGYNQSEVDDFLDRAAEALERVQRENQDLKERIVELDQAMAASRDTEEMLKKTLVTAQRAAEEAIANAKTKAEEMITEADAHVKRTDTESRERLARAEAESRRKVEDAEREAAERRRALDDRIGKLTAFERDARQRLKAFYEQQLRALDALTDLEPPRFGPPSARPAQGAQPTARPAGATPAAGASPASDALGEAQEPAGGGEGTQSFEVLEEGDDDASNRRSGVRDLFFRNQT
jgi:cell division initiation protein